MPAHNTADYQNYDSNMIYLPAFCASRDDKKKRYKGGAYSQNDSYAQITEVVATGIKNSTKQNKKSKKFRRRRCQSKAQTALIPNRMMGGIEKQKRKKSMICMLETRLPRSKLKIQASSG